MDTMTTSTPSIEFEIQEGFKILHLALTTIQEETDIKSTFHNSYKKYPYPVFKEYSLSKYNSLSDTFYLNYMFDALTLADRSRFRNRESFKAKANSISLHFVALLRDRYHWISCNIDQLRDVVHPVINQEIRHLRSRHASKLQSNKPISNTSEGSDSTSQENITIITTDIASSNFGSTQDVPDNDGARIRKRTYKQVAQDLFKSNSKSKQLKSIDTDPQGEALLVVDVDVVEALLNLGKTNEDSNDNNSSDNEKKADVDIGYKIGNNISGT